MIAEAFVNPLDFIFDSLLGSVYEFEHPDDYLMVYGVLFAELLENCDEYATYRRNDGCDDQRPVPIHYASGAGRVASHDLTASGVASPAT